MKMLKKSVPYNRAEVTKLVAILVFLISIATVTYSFSSELRVDTPTLMMLIASTMILGLFNAYRTIGSGNRAQNAFIYISLVWALSVALVLPVSTPLLIISPILIVISSTYLSSSHLLISALMIILGTEAGYILSSDHQIGHLIFLVLHSASLLIMAALGAIYKTSLQKSADSDSQSRIEANIEHERLRSLINSMTDAVIATDTQGNVEIYNGSALDILNLNVTLDNKIISDYLHISDKEGTELPLMDTISAQAGYLVSRDYLLDVGDGEKINLYISISPVKVGFGKAGEEGYIMLLRDITREKSLEEERDEFISVVSHELRTPITIAEGNISNALMVAEKQDVPEMITDALDASHKQVLFLADMINDLATLSRAERGKLHATPEDINVHELVKTLQRDYRMDAQQKGIEFSTHMDKNVDSLHSSRLYVREILQNFITNAIKYTQEGDVKLDVSNGKDGSVIFKVSDSGIGISKSDQKLLFRKFFRSEDYRTRENNGTGLGLYVTLKLAKLIKADIKVESVLDKGSTFIVEVPTLAEEPEETETTN